MRRTFLMIALAMAVLTADPASARKDRLVYYGDDPAGTVAYSLPSTTLTIDVEAIRENYYAGPYAQYAAKYLGIDVRKKDAVTCSLSDIRISSCTEPDTKRRFLLNMENAGSRTAMLELTSAGLVSVAPGCPDIRSWRFPAPSKADFSDKI